MARFAIDLTAVRETLGNRNFRMFTAGNAVSLLGTWVQRMAVGYLTWDLTKSGTWLGAVALAEFIPVIFLAPITGVVVDRFDRRRIAVSGQYLALLQATALAVLTITGHITAVLILLLQLFAGFVQPLIQTARLVLVPMMLPKERVGNGVAITSLIFNTARIVGPVLAGVIITTAGVGWSFALNAVSYFFVIAALNALHFPPHPPYAKPGGVWSGVFADMAAGWRYTFRHPVLGWVIPTVGVSSTLTWPIGDLLAGIADEMFNRGAAGLAAMTAAQGVGAILGGLVLAQRASVDGLSRLVIGAMVLSGLFMALFAMTTPDLYFVALALLALSAFFGVMVGVGSQSLTQTAVEDHMRGRSLSVWYTITRAGPAIGALILGALANVFGFSAPIMAAGAITAGVAALTLFIRNPQGAPPANGNK
ncbi:MAG: MFS transporter [Rhodospirillaceae bacterium]|nr:MFS transporter [Rhodospirillaceae bacterium]